MMYDKTQVEPESAHITELSLMVDRLKEEHGELMQVLLDMERQSIEAEREPDKGKAIQALLRLRLWAAAFQEELQKHSDWEEKELYPFLNIYFHKSSKPSIVPSIWMLEKEHELAMDNMNSFFRAVHALKPDSDDAAIRRAAAYLTHSCRILKDHLDKEQQFILPLTDQALTDLDYLFS